MKVPRRVHELWRRIAGRYTIDDPRPIAAEAPYTYFLPSENELLALAPGDQAKLVFRSHPPGREWDAERMWVTITKAGDELLEGTLDNQPSDMPQLGRGDVVRFRRSDAIDILWNEERVASPPPSPERREYWERCMVDDCIVAGRSPVDYCYREAPDLARPDDRFPDSGWRIRGTDEGIEADSRAERKPRYVAIGLVLNRDDTWLHLIDEPIGSRFYRDPRSGHFLRHSA